MSLRLLLCDNLTAFFSAAIYLESCRDQLGKALQCFVDLEALHTTTSTICMTANLADNSHTIEAKRTLPADDWT